MAVNDLGKVEPGSTIYLPFNTFDSNDPSASVTTTGLALADIKCFKDGSTTERASTSGFTLLDTDGIDFDTITGVHGISIDLSDNTTAGFWAAGSRYFVVISSITVDAATINFVLGTFTIGYEGAAINTTVATLASQTSFTLTSGPAEDNALNGCVICGHDVASAVQLGFGVVSAYTGSTKTVTLTAGLSFTLAATDNIAVYPPANTQWITSTAQTANDNGADINAILVDTNSLNDTKIPQTLNLTASGNIGIDWANVENATTAVDLSATDIQLCDTITTYTGNTVQTGDSFARLGAPAGASVSADIAAVQADTDDIQTRIPTSIVNGTADSGTTTTMVDAARTEADTDYWLHQVILFTSGSISGQARTITGFTPGTDTITFAPATTQAVGTNTYEIWPAGTDIANVIGTPTDFGSGTATIAANLQDLADNGTATFDRSTDSLQAIRDRGDSAWITGGGGGLTQSINPILAVPPVIDLANTASVRIGIILTNTLDDLPTTAEITPGTITIARKAQGGTSWSNVVSAAAMTEQDGFVYYDEVFDSGTGYAAGDMIRIQFESVSVTADANTYNITGATGVYVYSFIVEVMRGTDSAATASALATAQADLDILTGSDGATLATSQPNYTPAVAGDSMALTAAAVDAIWDESLTGHTTNQTPGKVLKGISEGWISAEGSVNDVSATTTGFVSDLTSSVDNFYNNTVLSFITGSLTGQSRAVSSYNGTTKAFTFDEAFTSAPANADQFIVLNTHVHPVSEIRQEIDANSTQLAAILADTAEIGTAGAGLTDLGGMSTTMKAQVNAEADTALTDYDPPTNAEMEARTPTAAQLAYITANAATGLPVTFSGTGTTTTGTLALVDGATPSSTDDQYNGRILVFNAGTLDQVATDITDYNGTSKVVTVTAVPVAITSSHTARLF